MSNEKLLPSAIDIEEAVIGAILIETDAINEVFYMLRPEMFYKSQHQTIYKAIQTLFNKSEAIDILTVSNELEKMKELENVGGHYGIALLSDKIGTGSNIVFHAKILQDKFMLREIIKSCDEAGKKAYDNNNNVLETLVNDVEKIQIELQGSKKEVEFAEAVYQVKKNFFENNGKGIQGILTGMRNFDEKMRGFDKTDLIIFAGRPGMGKTAFALDVANKIKEKVLFFSLEMSKEQLIKRKVKAQLDYETAERFELNKANDKDLDILTEVFGRVGEDSIIIDDSPYMTPAKIRAKSKLVMMREEVDMIIIDYLQLMTDEGNTKNEEVGNITRKLKLLAKELNVPVILISQLSRAVETRGGAKKPILSDLRDSGSIEQDADIVCFFYRPEYYGITECSINGIDGCDTDGCFIVDFAKYRSGSTGNVYLRANQNITSFSDWEQPTQNYLDLF